MKEPDDEDDEDEDKYAEDALMPGQKFETKQRITVRNLRIREDTAKVGFHIRTMSKMINLVRYSCTFEFQ